MHSPVPLRECQLSGDDVSGLAELQRSLHASHNLECLVELIPRQVRPLLACDAVHLWLFEADALTLMSTAGHDPTIKVGTKEAPGEGYVADMAESGKPLRIVDPEDSRLALRNRNDGPVLFTTMLVPLLQDGAEIGVLEAVNRSSGDAFTASDEALFCTVGQTVSDALKHSPLISAEKKLAVLEALMRVSAEIASAINLAQLSRLIVHSPQHVLPFDRCVLALYRRGKLQVRAVSGLFRLPYGDAGLKALDGLMKWLSTQNQELHFQQRGEGVEHLPSAVADHFTTSNFRALFALPLQNQNEHIGFLLFEGTNPEFFEVLHVEIARIVAEQGATALGHALLFRELPAVVMQPWLRAKKTLRAVGRSRQYLLLATVAAALLLLLCPFPARVAGVATVAAQHAVTVAAPEDGNVSAVYVHEGDRVEVGEVLGTLDDLGWRTDLLSAEARYRTATLTMEADLARGAAQAGADRAQVEFLRSEADRARARIASAQLRSPIHGIVMTPHIESVAGEHLYAGNTFAQVLDLSSAVIDVSIPQSDVALVRPTQSAVLKLESYPQKKWRGDVELVSAQAQLVNGEWTFAARVPLPNSSGLLRSGMTGSAKVLTGYRPLAYVLLRRPVLWAWQTAWLWFGW